MNRDEFQRYATRASNGLYRRMRLSQIFAIVLTPREERVVRLRIGVGVAAQTLQAIGDALLISASRVRSIELRAYVKIERHCYWRFPLTLSTQQINDTHAMRRFLSVQA